MKLSIVIPCFNERNTIAEIIAAVRASGYPDKRIIVVDDCSTDGTTELRKTQIEPSGLVHQVLYHTANQGKMLATGAVFTWNYLLRSQVIFRMGRAG